MIFNLYSSIPQSLQHHTQLGSCPSAQIAWACRCWDVWAALQLFDLSSTCRHNKGQEVVKRTSKRLTSWSLRHRELLLGYITVPVSDRERPGHHHLHRLIIRKWKQQRQDESEREALLFASKFIYHQTPPLRNKCMHNKFALRPMTTHTPIFKYPSSDDWDSTAHQIYAWASPG